MRGMSEAALGSSIRSHDDDGMLPSAAECQRRVHTFIRAIAYACAALVTVAAIATTAITLVDDIGALSSTLHSQSSLPDQAFSLPALTAASDPLNFGKFLEASPTISGAFHRRHLAGGPPPFLPNGCDIRHSGTLFDPARWAGSFQAGTMRWQPTPGRYLLLCCFVGQVKKQPGGGALEACEMLLRCTVRLEVALRVHWQGALAGCNGKVQWQGAVAGCSGRVQWQGAVAGCTGRVQWQGAVAGCTGRVTGYQ